MLIMLEASPGLRLHPQHNVARWDPHLLCCPPLDRLDTPGEGPLRLVVPGLVWRIPPLWIPELIVLAQGDSRDTTLASPSIVSLRLGASHWTWKSTSTSRHSDLHTAGQFRRSGVDHPPSMLRLGSCFTPV
jgi:hypothetical protein